MQFSRALLIGSQSDAARELEDLCADLGISETYLLDNLSSGFDTQLKDLAGVEAKGGTQSSRLLLVICPFTPGIRRQIAHGLSAQGFSASPPLIHPSASISSAAKIAEGSIIGRLVSVSNQSIIRRFTHLNRSSSIGHNCDVGDFVSVGPGVTVCGGVRIHQGAYIGAGATILPGVEIGANSLIGAGSVVLNDVAEKTIVVGNPARAIRVAKHGYGGYSV